MPSADRTPQWLEGPAIPMTVPGKFPDSEEAEALPQVARYNQERPPGLIASSLVHDSEVSSPAWHGILESVASVFDPHVDRVVCEGAPRPSRFPVTEFARGGSPLRSTTESVVVVPEQEGLAVALGLAVARGCFQQTHWIVVIASAEGLLRSMSHATIEQLHALRSGLLVVAVDDGRRINSRSNGDSPWNGQFDSLDARWLSEIGLEFGGPLDGDDPAALAAACRTIRESGRTHLLLVQSAPPFRGELPTESHHRGILQLPDASQPGERDSNDSLPAILDELRRICDRKSAVVVIPSLSPPAGPNHAPRTGTRRLVPDAGESVVARARGATLGGCQPVLLFDESSLSRNLTEIRTEICGPGRPATILLLESAAAEAPGDTRRPGSGPSPLAYLRLLPHTEILVPCDQEELRSMLRWSVEGHKPIAILVPGSLPVDLHAESPLAPFESGRGELIAEGFDLAIFALGPHLQAARDATLTLSRHGISAALVNARFAHPIDLALLERLADRVRGFVTVEPDGSHGGFGSTVLERLAAIGSSVPVIATKSSARQGTGSRAARKAIAHRIVEAALDLLDRGGAPARGDTRRNRITGGRRRRSEVEREFLLAPEKLKAERDLVRDVELSPPIKHWHELYASTGARSDYLWRWCLHGVRITTLPSVPAQLFDHVCDTKLASIILCVLFDDVADEHGSGRLLSEMLRVTRDNRPADFSGLDKAECLHVEITQSIWREYLERTRSYPRAEFYADLLQYDLMQFFNTMCYSQLLNSRPSLLNLTEHDLYTSHNMQMISFSTLDLMCSDGFSTDELGKLREAMWHAQCMGRIGNLLSTWQREIVNRDFTSGVFARAVSRGDVTLEQLTRGEAGVVESAILNGAHDQYFFRRWLQHREHLRFRASQIRSIDLRPVLAGHDRFLLMHLGCRGLI